MSMQQHCAMDLQQVEGMTQTEFNLAQIHRTLSSILLPQHRGRQHTCSVSQQRQALLVKQPRHSGKLQLQAVSEQQKPLSYTDVAHGQLLVFVRKYNAHRLSTCKKSILRLCWIHRRGSRSSTQVRRRVTQARPLDQVAGKHTPYITQGYYCLCTRCKIYIFTSSTAGSSPCNILTAG